MQKHFKNIKEARILHITANSRLRLAQIGFRWSPTSGTRKRYVKFNIRIYNETKKRENNQMANVR